MTGDGRISPEQRAEVTFADLKTVRLAVLWQLSEAFEKTAE